LKAHFAAEAKGRSTNFKVAGGFENQYRFRFFLSGGIDEGLGCVRGTGGKRDTMSFLLRPSDEGGFGRSKEVLGCLSGKKRGDSTGKCEREKEAVERSGDQTMRSQHSS
jgi:hypothetical protein